MNFKPANNRIILLDIVRGLAILGILLVNMLFSLPLCRLFNSNWNYGRAGGIKPYNPSLISLSPANLLLFFLFVWIQYDFNEG